MAWSLEMKELLGGLLVLGGGIGGMMGMILLPVMYFRLTRKYDPMFPGHANLTDGIGIQGEINRAGRYMWCIICKNLSQRNERIRHITGGYDFRGNASLFDIILCYSTLFFGSVMLVSAVTFFILTKILGIDL
ncbi:MAG: hypothetical protein L3J89_03855 [Gammaproteobacteria bacterium]|nr:hypothetical protein [Gammaproteobacteria bacterium]